MKLSSGRNRDGTTLNDLTQSLSRKYNYSMHVDRILAQKSRVDSQQPHMMQQLPAGQFMGVGPLMSLDRTLDFINENNALARRIGSMDRRRSSENTDRYKGASSSRRRGQEKEGSLNSYVRKQNQRKIYVENKQLSRTLIDAKPSISISE